MMRYVSSSQGNVGFAKRFILCAVVLTPRKCQGFGPLSNPHYQNALYLFQWSASAAKLWSSKICQIVQNYLEELVLEKTLRNFRGTQQNDKILEMFIGLI